MTPIVISPEDRDLLYHRILVDLSGVRALWLAAQNQDYETADRLGHEFCDELQLIIDDLGWGERAGDNAVELASSPEAEQESGRLRALCGELLGALDRPLTASGAEGA